MHLSPAPRLFLCSIAVLLLTLTSPAKLKSQTVPGPQSAPHSGTPPLPADQEQFISYWTTEAGWHSELELRNNIAAQDLTVTPVLRSADGTEAPCPCGCERSSCCSLLSRMLRQPCPEHRRWRAASRSCELERS